MLQERWLLSERPPSPRPRLSSMHAGPAILIDDISTIAVEPGCTAHITAAHDVRLELGAAAQGAGAGAGAAAAAAQAAAQVECDPIQLAIFSHRCGVLWG